MSGCPGFRPRGSYAPDDHPRYGRKHANPADRSRHVRDLNVVVEQTQATEKIVPIVDDVAGVAHREQRQFLCAGIGHVDGNGQKLLEEKNAQNATPCTFRWNAKYMHSASGTPNCSAVPPATLINSPKNRNSK